MQRSAPTRPTRPYSAGARYENNTGAAETFPNRATAGTCTVTTNADSGAGSLRQCLLDAVAGDTLGFDPAVFPPLTPETIALLSPLPWITADDLIIDGSNAGVILNGSLLSEGAGLVIDGADKVKVRGLQIMNFPWDGVALINGATNAVIGGNHSLNRGNLISGNGLAGVWVSGAGTDDNRILGNYIGTDVTGQTSMGNGWGVEVTAAAKNNVIGGGTAETRNLISGNNNTGVGLWDSGTTGNQIAGNYIGIDVSGQTPLSNTWGVIIGSGAQDNIMGGTSTNAGNLISGNTEIGVTVQDVDTSGNQISGNYIGTNAGGTNPVGNRLGIIILPGAQDNIVGGTTAAARNIISGNTKAGIEITGGEEAGTSGNRVIGNYIGTDVNGTRPLGNGNGIAIGLGAQNNVIGGNTPGSGNLISGNIQAGIFIATADTDGNSVIGNYIGTDVTGTLPLGNGGGIAIQSGAQNNVIGGDTPESRNLISGNLESAIQLSDPGTSDNRILGNYIGADVTGTTSLGNVNGIIITSGARDNVIGGNSPESGNLISGNTNSGIQIEGDGTASNRIMGNYIGTDKTGTAALGNDTGVAIVFGAQDNLIGGVTSGSGNLISGNLGSGIVIQVTGTTGNRVLGNYIGTDKAGHRALGNDRGIIIGFGATSNFIGGETTGSRNVISGNHRAGIQIQDPETRDNRVQGNYIGTDITGTTPLGNDTGIVVLNAQDNLIGGDAAGARNVISGNDTDGVDIQGAQTRFNKVQGNYVGPDETGLAAVGNQQGGIVIHSGAQNNLIGGETPEARNLISGNVNDGVGLVCGGAQANQIWGNWIGTDVTGHAPLGNDFGVAILAGAQNNEIGGTTPEKRNIISGNLKTGVHIQGEITGNCPDSQGLRAITSGNSVQGNYIGLNATGTAALANKFGVDVTFGAQNNTIGGLESGARNVISGNELTGVLFEREGTEGNLVLGNYIGTDPTGTKAIGNKDGVVIGFGATNNTIGGESTAARNILSGNRVSGLVLFGEDTANNRILGNYIGTDHSGMHAVANGESGVAILFGPQHNTVGGLNPNARNVISGNGASCSTGEEGHGVRLEGTDTRENELLGNAIGSDATGENPLPNGGHGVYLADGAQSNKIGEQNSIVYNRAAGIAVDGQQTLGNTITRNHIHSNGRLEIAFLDPNTPAPLPPPAIAYARPTNTVSGTVCVDCIVEIFGHLDSEPAGVEYIGMATADGTGAFTFTHNSLSAWTFLAVTLTEPSGTTSPFYPISNSTEAPDNGLDETHASETALTAPDAAQQCPLYLPVIFTPADR